jgi:hypothetical protein
MNSTYQAQAYIFIDKFSYSWFIAIRKSTENLCVCGFFSVVFWILVGQLDNEAIFCISFDCFRGQLCVFITWRCSGSFMQHSNTKPRNECRTNKVSPYQNRSFADENSAGPNNEYQN